MSDRMEVEAGPLDGDEVARRIVAVGMAVAEAAEQLKEASERLLAEEDQLERAELRARAAADEVREAELRARAAEQQAGQAELRAQAAEEQAREVAERLQAAEEDANQAATRLLVAEAQTKQADVRMQAVEEQAAQTAAKSAELLEHLQQARGEYAGVEERARRAEERLHAESERARTLDEQLQEIKARLAEAKGGQPVAVVADKERSALQEAVATEVRRPLTSILGITLALKHHDPDSRDGPEMVRQLATNARKLDRMISVLLELDRLADGSLKPNRRRTDLQALVRRVVEDSPDLANRNVNVEAEKVVVAVDPSMTEQMIETLLANAGRRTSSGNPVWVTVSSDPEGAVIAVDDTGPDVPEGLRKTLLASSMDERAGARRGRAPTGLTVLSRLAEVHGGRAWVEEREGGGTSFRVFLPEVLDASDGLAAGGPGFAALAPHDAAADGAVTI